MTSSEPVILESRVTLEITSSPSIVYSVVRGTDNWIGGLEPLTSWSGLALLPGAMPEAPLGYSVKANCIWLFVVLEVAKVEAQTINA
jgi:hypothetical protein